jgi:hypothetical protein
MSIALLFFFRNIAFGYYIGIPKILPPPPPPPSPGTKFFRTQDLTLFAETNRHLTTMTT